MEAGVATTMDIEDRVGTGTINETLSVVGTTITYIQTEVCELIMCKQVHSVGNGVGIGETLTTVLAKEPDTANNKIECHERNVENQGVQQATKMSQTQVNKAAKLGLEFATELRLGLNKNNVIMKSMSGVKSLTGSPKVTTFKQKITISKIALPEWLHKWQKLPLSNPPL